MARHGLILAAGRGTRLGTLTAGVPKPLLDVGGRPLLDRILSALEASGVPQVAVVAGHLAGTIERHLAGRPGVAVVRQERQDGTGGAFLAARDLLGEADIVFSWGDIVVDPADYHRVQAHFEGCDAVIAVNEVDDPSAGAAVTVDGSGWVTAIVEKPPPGRSQTPWNSSGLGVLAPGIWPYLDAVRPSARGELEFTDALGAWIAAGARVRAVPVEGPWFDIGTPESLEAARRHLTGGG